MIFSKNSLFRQAFLLIVITLMSVVAIFSISSIHDQELALQDVMYSKAKTTAKSISLVTSDAMVVEDYSFIVEHNEKVIDDNNELLYIMVVKKGEKNSILYNGRNAWRLLDKLPKKIYALNGSKEKSTIFSCYLAEDQESYNFSYPVVFSGIEWGWVIVGSSLEKYNAQMKTIYLNSIFLLITTFFASIAFSFILARWLVKPVLLLNTAAKKVSSGDLSVEVKVLKNDELGELANSFNAMVNTIKLSNEQMNKYNEKLELRVSERTNELNNLNMELDQRVKDEVNKRTEQEQILIQQSRFAAMGEMIGNIAHQWRQPLNALGLLLQNIENAYEMEMLDEAYIKRTVAKGNRLTDSMSHTIDDFRNFFKPNKENEVFSISSSLATTMDMIRSSLDNNLIMVTQEIDTSVCIKGFTSEFSQVILNILNNAKDALVEKNHSDKKLSIRVFKEEEYAFLEIEDNAGGIPKDIIAKIFDPYFTTKDEGNGTGIGLYMSKTIVKNSMKGILSATNSEYGAKFIIKIKSETCQG